MKHKEKKKHLERKFLQQPGKKSKRRKGKLDFQDVLQSRAKVLALTQDHQVADTSSSNSEDFPYGGKFLDAELQHSPEDAPETHEVVPSSSLDIGEISSASEHLPCLSSSRMHIHVDLDGLGSSKMLLNQDLMETENSSFMSHSHLPSSSASNPLVSAVSTENNVYYKPVAVKRGVAALEDKEDLEPPAKMIRIGKVTCPERIPPKASLPYVCLERILTDDEDGLDREWQEEREEDLAQEAGPSAKTPAELEDMYSGFRCMGCCQVFPNLQMLEKHMEHEVEEGVSCPNLASAKLRNKRKTSKISRENTNITTAYGDDIQILLRFLMFLAFCTFLFYFNK
ncbi:protein FAM170A-like isoform 1-T23 [Erethizon dorsatum]